MDQPFKGSFSPQGRELLLKWKRDLGRPTPSARRTVEDGALSFQDSGLEGGPVPKPYGGSNHTKYEVLTASDSVVGVFVSMVLGR